MPRLVVVEGDPRARGRALGRELGEEIHRSLAFYRAYFARRGVDRDALARLAAPFREAAERGLPDLVAMVDATAAGAEADPDELFALNAFEEVSPLVEAPAAVERCTTFTVVTPERTILAHNEQWFAADAENTVVVVERGPGVAVVSPTIAPCLASVGMSSHDGAQGIDSLVAADDRPGIPRVLVSRHALEAASRSEALARAGISGRAGGYAHVFAFAGGDAFTLETSARKLALLEGSGGHANHYLDPDLAAVGSEPSPGSVSRQERLEGLLRERPPSTPEQAMEILRDHDSAPQAICKHASGEDDEESAVVFSMVCELEARRMWVAQGNPCRSEFEEVDTADVV